MAITEDFTKPDFANGVSTDLDQIRDNFNFLLAAAANGSIVVPGWTTRSTPTRRRRTFPNLTGLS